MAKKTNSLALLLVRLLLVSVIILPNAEKLRSFSADVTGIVCINENILCRLGYEDHNKFLPSLTHIFARSISACKRVQLISYELEKRLAKGLIVL